MFHEDIGFVSKFLFMIYWCMHCKLRWSNIQFSNVEFKCSLLEKYQERMVSNYYILLQQIGRIANEIVLKENLLWSIGPSLFATLNKISAVQNSGTRTNNLPASAGKWKPNWCNNKMNGSYERILLCSAFHGTTGTECFFTTIEIILCQLINRSI